MEMSRRTLLIGAGVGALTVLLASCTPEPTPSPTPTDTSAPTLPPFDGPEPTASVRSTWSTDPYARGAASFTPVGAQSAERDALAEPVAERVFFAGEATDADAPGTMRGAIRSGERVASDLRGRAMNGERIAVVGAGLAGAAAAVQLATDGADVTVFEARDRVGGRVESRVDEEAWPLPVQLGGWLLSAQDDELRDSFSERDLRMLELNAPSWRSAEGAVDPTDPATVDAAVQAAQARPVDESVADALTESGADLEDPALVSFLSGLAAASGADADLLSSWFAPAMPQDSVAAPSADLSALIADQLADVQVRLSSPVSKVAYDDTGVSLQLGTGESMSFDRVVLTVPLGVLQHGGVDFSPALPFPHRGAIGSLGMGSIETIWLRFDEPFWDAEETIWHVVGGDAAVRTWLNLQPVTGEAVLVGLVGGLAAQEFAALDDQAAVIAAVTALGPFTTPAEP